MRFNEVWWVLMRFNEVVPSLDSHDTLATNSLKASDQNLFAADSVRILVGLLHLVLRQNTDSLVIKSCAELTLGLIHAILGIRCSLISMFFDTQRLDETRVWLRIFFVNAPNSASHGPYSNFLRVFTLKDSGDMASSAPLKGRLNKN